MPPPVTPPHDPSISAVPPQRLRRRTIASVLWALALGAATTIAIAWGLAVGVSPIYHPTGSTIRKAPGGLWTVQQYKWYGSLTDEWIPHDWASRTGSTIEEFDVIAEETIRTAGITRSNSEPMLLPTDELLRRDQLPVSLIEHARGWPLLALGCLSASTVVQGDADWNPSQMMHVRFGFPFRNKPQGTWQVDLVHLPLRPLFPGFYLNTALFAALWWAALFWRPLRRRRRIARGQCPACAYSLAGLPEGSIKCPECGGPVSPAAPKP